MKRYNVFLVALWDTPGTVRVLRVKAAQRGGPCLAWHHLHTNGSNIVMLLMQ